MSSLGRKILTLALLFWLVNAQQLVGSNIVAGISSSVLQASADVITRSSSTTTDSSIQGVIDAHNDPPLSWVSYEEEASGRAYAQPFTPSLPVVTGVNIGLSAWQQANVTVEIREMVGNSSGAVLASSERSLPKGYGGYYHFSFSPPATVTPGKEYLIVFKGPPEIPVPTQPHMTRKNLVLFVLIIEKSWKGPYVMHMADNGTLIPFQYASVLRPALMFRTYGLETLPTPATSASTPTTSPQEIPGSPPESIAAGLMLGVLALLGLRRLRRRG